MSNQNLTQFNLNRFFKEIHIKKQYLKKMQNKTYFLNKKKETNYKTVGHGFYKNFFDTQKNAFVMYVVDISFSKKNTLFHVSDCCGNILFFHSAGSFQYKGKEKVSRSAILRKFYTVMLSKFKFLQGFPIAVHFKNSDSNMFWFLKKLKKKFFVVTVKHFNLYSYNGCRKKKIRRKKFKNKL